MSSIAATAAVALSVAVSSPLAFERRSGSGRAESRRPARRYGQGHGFHRPADLRPLPRAHQPFGRGWAVRRTDSRLRVRGRRLQDLLGAVLGPRQRRDRGRRVPEREEERAPPRRGRPRRDPAGPPLRRRGVRVRRLALGQTRAGLPAVDASRRKLQGRPDRVDTARAHRLGLAGGPLFLHQSRAGHAGLGGDRGGGQWNAAARFRLDDARGRPPRRHAAPRPAAGPARSRAAVHPLARRLLRFHLQVEGRHRPARLARDTTPT